MTDPVAAYTTFVQGLPLIAQPMVKAFTVSLPFWLAIAIYEQRWTAKHGARPPAKKMSNWLALLIGGAFLYLRIRYPEVRAISDWPDKHIPGLHLHWWQWVIGGFAAGFVAKWLTAAFAALFQRGGGNGYGGGQGGIRIGVTPVRRVWVERD